MRSTDLFGSVAAESGLQQGQLRLDGVLIIRREICSVLRAIDFAVEQGHAVLQAQRAVDQLAEAFRQVVPAGAVRSTLKLSRRTLFFSDRTCSRVISPLLTAR